GVPAHELAALGRRIGGEDFKALSIQTIVTERETRAVVHGRLIVDHRDLPTRTLFRRLVARIVDQVDDVVLSHAPCPPLCGLRRRSFAGRYAREGEGKTVSPSRPAIRGPVDRRAAGSPD